MKKGLFYKIRQRRNRRRRIENKIETAVLLLERITHSDWGKDETVEMALASLIGELERAISIEANKRWKENGMEINVDERVA